MRIMSHVGDTAFLVDIEDFNFNVNVMRQWPCLVVGKWIFVYS